MTNKEIRLVLRALAELVNFIFVWYRKNGYSDDGIDELSDLYAELQEVEKDRL